MTEPPPLAAITDTGTLGACHLKRLWSRTMRARSGVPAEAGDEEHLDRLVLDGLGLGLQQALQHLYVTAPTFPAFEAWIVATAGQPDRDRITRLNADLNGAEPPDTSRTWLEEIDAMEPVLDAGQLAFWDQNGYVILHEAIGPGERRAAEEAVWKQVGAEPGNIESWYREGGAGIMVELIQHPAFEAARRSPRIHKAFAQLWGTADLWVSTDRCGFHVPQREGHPFPGPDLHWDLDFTRPPTFGTQGILYLTETPPEQGALTVVPGFHRRLADWLQSLPPGSDPQKEDLHALGSVPVGGRAGDLIIWNHALPHGSRPNMGSRPRIVQYLNMYPGRRQRTSGCYHQPVPAP